MPQFLGSSVPELISWQDGVSKLDGLLTIFFALFITLRHGPQSNHSSSLLREFVSSETCLSIRSIATAVRITSRIFEIPLLLRAGIT
jgi:hypothetical protein